jgi:hypothetical protein
MSADAHEESDILVSADVVADPAEASAAWRRALKELLGDKQRFDSWPVGGMVDSSAETRRFIPNVDGLYGS